MIDTTQRKADTDKLRHVARGCVDVHDKLEQSGHFPFGSPERKFLMGTSRLLFELADKFDATAASQSAEPVAWMMKHRIGPDRGLSWTADNPDFSGDWQRIPLYVAPSQSNLDAEAENGAFEEWAMRHGGLVMQRALDLRCRDGRFPATYREPETETAWRAWANKTSAICRQSAEPVALTATLERDLERVMEERDAYHDMADKLSNGIAEHFDIDIGEHSNMNCPWQNALDAMETAICAQGIAATGAQGLTERFERIKRLALDAGGEGALPVPQSLRKIVRECLDGVSDVSQAAPADKPGALTDEREAFETAWRAEYPRHTAGAFKYSGMARGGYANTRVNDGWKMWQARAILAASPAPAQGAQEDARFEVRIDGNTVAGAEGEESDALREATHYFYQYIDEAEAEAELVQIQRVLHVDRAAMSREQSQGGE
ncbi:hypothetical protein HTY52_28930 [Cupriavidus taiwanensis]|uniref:hypothetical protein n=1 Tax=Cupriavidus taiwanensis TaxID=164546 RepID=UPI00157235FE|nr:hypothetical protein [Cupriavidus taiwanensis]NSX18132.1 hypothetical protein [Cupriavidus taiwanensis]